ncbi:hypothetical protein HYH02_005769 [Chlamydomonas schloesseri]|uniref:EF-hand domain-containing protein n=1 Tax=Chlamydomonas schloesseri TaxID=2026947 RepID=A0A836B6K4_9CHLO|nr:hypothetical protein HYH02_005769 [Chlamydomonas schloesseri]|eukprot:KAG2449015.1 hypothetical protein HYH02_005769 [Chlamydomonas schloesseri]
MVRVPNPFRRRSRGGSGTSTPAASSVAPSVAPSEPGSPHRTLSSHALAPTAADRELPHPPAPASPSPAGSRVSASGSTSGQAHAGRRGDEVDSATSGSTSSPLLPAAASPGLGAALQGAGVAAAGAAGAARDAAAAAADVVASVLPAAGGVIKPGGRAEKPRTPYGDDDTAMMKAKQLQLETETEMQREQRHLQDKAAAAAEAAWCGRGAIARFTAPEQDGPAASLLMPPGVSGGGLAVPPPPAVVGNIPAAPLTMARPVPLNLPDYMDKPGEPHVTATPDRYHPKGGPLTPPDGSGLTSLQQHFAFFDIDKDGIITPWECVNGFRYLLRRYLPEPLNTLACIPLAAAVQLPLAWLTSDSWLPDPLLRVHVKNAHKVVHGSNSRAWDRSGRFTPARFEALLSKYDADGKGGLSGWEVLQMVRGQANLGDLLGTLASAGEWAMTWALLCDSGGVLRREDMRGMYDGTAFYRAAARNGYAHYTLETGRAPAVAKGYA